MIGLVGAEGRDQQEQRRCRPGRNPSSRRSRGRVRSIRSGGSGPDVLIIWRWRRKAPSKARHRPITRNAGATRISQDADIRVGEMGQRIQQQQQKEGEQTPHDHHQPRQAEPVPKDGGAPHSGVAAGVSELIGMAVCVNIRWSIDWLLGNGRALGTPPPRGAGGGVLAKSVAFPAAFACAGGTARLLLELPHVGDQALDVVVGQAFGRAHQLLAVFVLEPSLMALKAASSFSSACTLASV